MTRLRFLLALAVIIVCFLLLVGSDANITPVRNIILLAVYCASGYALSKLISKGRHA